MTRRPIGYYVHHHGAGHLARAEAIAAASDWPIVLLGTGIGLRGIDLPDDRAASDAFDGADGVHDRPNALHYAPLDHEGVRARVAHIARWIADERPAMMVVDVSVEIAMLARLASVPVIYVRLNGERGDEPHLDAFRGANGLLAPFAASFDLPSTPQWVRHKTYYQPGITAGQSYAIREDGVILVIAGRGGPPADGDRIAEAARACPELLWRVIGPATAASHPPPNLQLAGWVDDPLRDIAKAAIVIGGAGDGLVGAVLAAGRPFICIPQDRPFDEQRATAAGLAAQDAAIVLGSWPSADSWPTLIQRATALSPAAASRLHDPEGARKAAAWLARHAALACEAGAMAA